MRARVDELLAGIPLPTPFDIHEFCATLAARRGRPIALTPASRLLTDRAFPFSGLWIAAPGGDHVFYDDSTSPLHWENSVLHELGHMLFGHRARGMLDEGQLRLLGALLPDLSADRLRGLLGGTLGRAGFTDRQEREAELFAARVWELAGRTLVRVRHPGADGPVLDRLADALGPGAP